MKSKYLKLMIAAMAFVFILAACGDGGSTPAASDTDTDVTTDPAPADTDTEAGTEPTAETVDVNVMLISHSPAPYSTLDDGSFNQGAQDGILRFAADFPGTINDFMQPHEASDEARLNVIEMAIDAGANVIVLPGFHFENALYEAQDLFPDTMFILLDASPRNPETGEVRVEANVAAIHYAEEQSGFLAGYAAVIEGYRDLGFLGGLPVPAVVRFGSGFVQGAEFAAEYLGLEAGEVTIHFEYLGGFGPSPENQATAGAIFASGTEVIFVAAGGAGNSVMAAAEASGASVIGVDVDQYWQSETVITSALKGLEVSVYDLLAGFAQGQFGGGSELRFEASNNGVGLAMDTARLQNFTQDQYDSIFTQLANGEISVDGNSAPDFVPETVLVTVNVQ